MTIFVTNLFSYKKRPSTAQRLNKTDHFNISADHDIDGI